MLDSQPPQRKDLTPFCLCHGPDQTCRGHPVVLDPCLCHDRRHRGPGRDSCTRAHQSQDSRQIRKHIHAANLRVLIHVHARACA